jgi:hypothetical protein
MCGLQSLPCWHSSCLQCVILVDRIPGRSTWGPPTIYVHPWTAVGGEGREGLLSVPDRLSVVSIVLACPPYGSISSRPDIDVFMAGRDIILSSSLTISTPALTMGVYLDMKTFPSTRITSRRRSPMQWLRNHFQAAVFRTGPYHFARSSRDPNLNAPPREGLRRTRPLPMPGSRTPTGVTYSESLRRSIQWPHVIL